MQVSTSTRQPGSARVGRRAAYPAGGVGFDRIAAALGLLVVLGIYLDAWAHNHGRVDQSFFTPWHGILYTAFGLGGTLAVYVAGRNRQLGYPWRRALPRGYWLSLVGVGVFALGGVGDMIWHMLFGIESDVEAIVSPSHLMLGIGLTLMLSGPVRAALHRLPSGSAPGWRALGPLLLSVALLMALLNGFTIFAHPLADTFAASSPALEALVAEVGGVKLSGGQHLRAMVQSVGVASVLIQVALQMGFVLPLVRRWRLPFGALTLVLALPAALMCVQHDRYLLLPGVVAAGLIADLLARRVEPVTAGPLRFYLFAVATPAVYYALYFASLAATSGLGWTMHLVGGSIFLAGATGLLVSFLIVSPLPDGPSGP